MRAIIFPITLAVCVAAYLVQGIPALILAWIAMQLFWVAYITVFPKYVVKKMDGTEFTLKRTEVARNEINSLRRAVRA